MAKRNRTHQELLALLKETLSFLKLSCKSFDSGHHGEAKRLAVVIRVLLHDTPNSESLLYQLGLKNNMTFYNTATPRNPNNILKAHHGLVYPIFGNNGGSFTAPLEKSVEMTWKANKFVSFQDWWNEMILMDTEEIKYTRQDLIKLMSNKEGGAHVDPKIDNDYVALKEGNRMIYYIEKEVNGIKESTGIKEVELHSIRQIAFELITSIEKEVDFSSI